MILQKWVATEIAKDLIRLDQADSTISLLELEIDNYVRQLGIQERTIESYKQNISNLEEIIANRLDAIDVKAFQAEK